MSRVMRQVYREAVTSQIDVLMVVEDFASVELNNPTLPRRHALLLFNLVLHSGSSSRPFDSWVMRQHNVSKLRCVFYVVFTFHFSQLF